MVCCDSGFLVILCFLVLGSFLFLTTDFERGQVTLPTTTNNNNNNNNNSSHCISW